MKRILLGNPFLESKLLALNLAAGLALPVEILVSEVPEEQGGGTDISYNEPTIPYLPPTEETFQETKDKLDEKLKLVAERGGYTDLVYDCKGWEEGRPDIIAKSITSEDLVRKLPSAEIPTTSRSGGKKGSHPKIVLRHNPRQTTLNAEKTVARENQDLVDEHPKKRELTPPQTSPEKEEPVTMVIRTKGDENLVGEQPTKRVLTPPDSDPEQERLMNVVIRTKEFTILDPESEDSSSSVVAAKTWKMGNTKWISYGAPGWETESDSESESESELEAHESKKTKLSAETSAYAIPDHRIRRRLIEVLTLSDAEKEVLTTAAKVEAAEELDVKLRALVNHIATKVTSMTQDVGGQDEAPGKIKVAEKWFKKKGIISSRKGLEGTAMTWHLRF